MQLSVVGEDSSELLGCYCCFVANVVMDVHVIVCCFLSQGWQENVKALVGIANQQRDNRRNGADADVDADLADAECCNGLLTRAGK